MPRRAASDPSTQREAGTRRRATIRDVADRVGVSLITVSRALRQPEVVSEALRTRIRAAVDELGYVPNRAASGLASGTARVVPVVVPTLAHSVYVPFLDGVQSELSRHGYQVLLGTTEYRVDLEDELVAALLGWSPDALFLAGVDHSAGTRRRLERAGIPVVEYMDLAENPLGLNVGFSHRAVGESVAVYLASKGYRRIAYAGTHTESDQKSVKRIDGFRAALRERGLLDHLIIRSNEASSVALGGRLVGEVLRQFTDVEAVFFGNDDLAAGAVMECRRRGLLVPGQFAIMGFNDQEIAAAMTPSITSVAVPRREMGVIAARMVLDQLNGKPLAEMRVDLGFQIIERESTNRQPATPSEMRDVKNGELGVTPNAPRSKRGKGNRP